MAVTNPNDPVILQVQLELDRLEESISVLEDALQRVAKDFIKQINDEISGGLKLPDGPNNTTEKKQDKESQEKAQKVLGAIQGATDKIADAGVSVIQSVFELVGQIYERLKKSSPLLEAVERIFNLVWMLFFMPLGNKLAETLIPAVIKMMDDVMDIWDAFEGKSLGDMFELAIEKGVELMSSFLLDIGSELSKESGLVGAIGNMLVTMGEFIRDHGAELLTAILNIASWVLEHLKEIIAAIVAFEVVSIGLQLTQIAVLAAGLFAVSGGASVAAAGVGVGASAVAGAVAYGGVSNYFAEGGYVPATPGGQLAVIGEGGEGEYVIPESKMGSMGGNTYYIQIYSYSDEELTRKVKSIVSGQISDARLRSGF